MYEIKHQQGSKSILIKELVIEAMENVKDMENE